MCRFFFFQNKIILFRIEVEYFRTELWRFELLNKILYLNKRTFKKVFNRKHVTWLVAAALQTQFGVENSIHFWCFINPLIKWQFFVSITLPHFRIVFFCNFETRYKWERKGPLQCSTFFWIFHWNSIGNYVKHVATQMHIDFSAL